MRLALVATLLLAGCGRIGFDPGVATDAAGGHDEDSDGIVDREDVCPHIANEDQADQDLDGVGDACDREPLNGRQTLAYFNAMQPEDEALIETGRGVWTQRADAREFDGGGGGGANGQLGKIIPLGDADIWLGATIVSQIPGAPGHQLAIALLDVTDSAQYYYAQFYEDGGGANILFSEWTGPGGSPPNRYLARGSQPLAGSLHTGDVVLYLGARLTPRQIDVSGGWGPESYSTGGPAPLYDGVDRLRVPTEGLVVAVTYLAIVTTQ